MIRDTQLKSTKALPAAGATNYSDGIDLLDTNPGIKMRNAEYEVVIPATPSLVEAKTVILTPQDSADDSTYADIASLLPVTVTGAAAAAGGDAVTLKYKLPENVRRYVRTKAVVLAAGGDNTALSVVSSIVY